jgi:5-formyltetrahydrofolate cyclo-ligase
MAENPTLNSAFRADLRRAAVSARLAMTGAEHARLSALIEGHLHALLMPRPPGVLAFCWPIRAEFDARPLLAQLLDRGWGGCVPTVMAPHAPMVFRAWTPDSAMTEDRHGIPIPAADGQVIPDVILLPVVAFDAMGFRLGYGGGYFDRTLAGMVPRPLAIGVGFELARVETIRPEPHDIALDAVVTETGVRRFKFFDRP